MSADKPAEGGDWIVGGIVERPVQAPSAPAAAAAAAPAFPAATHRKLSKVPLRCSREHKTLHECTTGVDVALYFLTAPAAAVPPNFQRLNQGCSCSLRLGARAVPRHLPRPPAPTSRRSSTCPGMHSCRRTNSVRSQRQSPAQQTGPLQPRQVAEVIGCQVEGLPGRGCRQPAARKLPQRRSAYERRSMQRTGGSWRACLLRR